MGSKLKLPNYGERKTNLIEEIQRSHAEQNVERLHIQACIAFIELGQAGEITEQREEDTSNNDMPELERAPGSAQ